jgi:hypothetical protein
MSRKMPMGERFACLGIRSTWAHPLASQVSSPDAGSASSANLFNNRDFQRIG